MSSSALLDSFEVNEAGCMVYGYQDIMRGEYQLAKRPVWWSYVVVPLGPLKISENWPLTIKI